MRTDGMYVILGIAGVAALLLILMGIGLIRTSGRRR